MTDLRTPWAPPDPEERQATVPEAPSGNSWVRMGLVVAGVLLAALMWGWWVVLVIACFLVLLFVHELGHFLAARRAGMKVTEFFLGFGPRLWSFRRGEVEYGLKAIPLGAYVRIIGMNNLEDVDPADEPRTYRAKGYWSRFCVAVAGVSMNFALALVLLFVALVGFGLPKDTSWFVGTITPGSPAAQAGLQDDDRIVAIDGRSVSTFGDLTSLVRARPGEDVTLTVVRDGQQLALPVALADHRPDSSDRVGFLGISEDRTAEKVGALSGVQESFVQFGTITSESVTGLGRIFSPGGVRNYAELLSNDSSADPNQRLLSPVGAVKIGSEVAETSFGSFILLFAAINIFVGLINLVPLLPFDGGHIAIATYEAIRSRKGKPYRADIRKLLPVSYAVMAIFVVLAISNLYLDLKM